MGKVIFNCVIIAIILSGCEYTGSTQRQETLTEETPAESLKKAPNFADYITSLPVTPDGGYVVEGDIPIYSEEDLYQYYLAFYGLKQSIQTDSLTATQTDGLTLQSVVVTDANGNDVIWNATDRQNLTYCIDNSISIKAGIGAPVDVPGPYAFGTNYDTVVNAMARATADWEASANVNFTHMPLEDDTCSASNANVMFRIRKSYATWQGNPNLATAFFPDYPPLNRTLWIAADTVQNPASPLSFVGILRHELGHILGLAHENGRLSQCQVPNLHALTAFDLYSVMFSRTGCGAPPGTDYFLTQLDKDGIVQLYPFPPPPMNSPPIARIHAPASGMMGQDMIFDGTASNDVDGDSLTYKWNFGDGSTTTTLTPVITHKYLNVGNYTASLVVNDGKVDSTASTISTTISTTTANFAWLVPIISLILN